MTITIQSTDSIGTGVRFTYAAFNDTYAILAGVTVASTTVGAINAGGLSNLTLDIAGTLITANVLQLSGDNNWVTIASTGRFVGFVPSSTSSALYLAGNGGRLDTAGEIISERSIGVLSNGGNDVVNTGRIVGSSGVFLGLFSNGGDTLVNAGQITANRVDDGVNNTRYNNGVFSEGTSRITNLEGGVITAVSSEGAGVRLGAGAFNSVVQNDGVIEAAVWYGVDFSDLGASEFARLTNTGTIRGGAGAFNGNDTTDTVTNSGTMVGQVFLNDGNDVFDGRGGRVEGVLFGGNGNDTADLRGDSLVTGAIDMGAGFDTVRGSDGADTARGGADGDDVSGNGGDDLLTGDAGIDTLYGGVGNDNVLGGADDDFVFGGDGNDTLEGGSGFSQLWGGAGDDFIRIDPELASVLVGTGGAGDDEIYGGFLTDTILGGDGTDSVYGGNGGDNIQGNQGDDILDIAGGDDTAYGDKGDDTVYGAEGFDLIEGGTGDDLLFGDLDNDTILGGGGFDQVYGGDGNDNLSGGGDDDLIDGGGNNDIITGGTGADTLLGAANADVLEGGDGDDLLNGGSGGDALAGGRGNDALIGDTGTDTMSGGAGEDIFVFALVTHSAVGGGADRIEDFLRGDDLIDIAALAAAPFVFRGTSAFSGAGVASVRYDVTGTSVTVRIDATGDGVVDSEVVLAGLSNLNAADFLL